MRYKEKTENKENKYVKIFNNKKSGNIAGSPFYVGKKKYLRVTMDGESYFAHRVAFAITYGYLPKEIDHINGNGTDNSIKNLAPASRTSNARNMRLYATNTTGRTGVYRSGKSYYAQIKINGKLYHIGCFNDFDLACEARAKAEKDNNFHVNHGSKRPL